MKPRLINVSIQLKPYKHKHIITEVFKINSERKTNSENSAWTCSARPAKARRKRGKTNSPRRPLRRLGALKAPPVGFGVRIRTAYALPNVHIGKFAFAKLG